MVTRATTLDHVHGTERMRRDLEQEIRRGMGELDMISTTTTLPLRDFVNYDNNVITATSEDENEDEDEDEDERDLRQILEDETTTDTEHEIEPHQQDTTEPASLGDDFSLKFGIAGTRQDLPATTTTNPPPQQHDTRIHHADDSNDLTYLSAPDSTRPWSPPSPAPLHGRSSTTLPRRPMTGPPSMPSLDHRSTPLQQHNNRIPTPVLTSHPSRLTPFPPSYKSSAPPAPQITKQSVVAAAAPVALPSRVSAPTPPQQSARTTTSSNHNHHNNNIRWSFATSPNYHSLSSSDKDTTRIKLPDVTGLTEGLHSPVKSKPVQFNPTSTETHEERDQIMIDLFGLKSNGNSASMMTKALDQLKRKLNLLEQDNTLSQDKVHELEYRLQQAKKIENKRSNSKSTSDFDKNSMKRDQDHELNSQLRQEQLKRQALEEVVDNLEQRVSNLNHSIQNQSNMLKQIQTHPSPYDVRTKNEMKLLRSDLKMMGLELMGLKNVLEDVLKQQLLFEQQQQQQQQRDERERMTPVDPDLTPRPNRNTWSWSGPETPSTVEPIEVKQPRLSPSPEHKSTTRQHYHRKRDDQSIKDETIRKNKNDINHHKFDQKNDSIPLRFTKNNVPSHIHSALSIASCDDDDQNPTRNLNSKERDEQRLKKENVKINNVANVKSKNSIKPMTRVTIQDDDTDDQNVQSRPQEENEEEEDLTMEFERAKKIFKSVDKDFIKLDQQNRQQQQQQTFDSNHLKQDQVGNDSLDKGFLIVNEGEECAICFRRQERLKQKGNKTFKMKDKINQEVHVNVEPKSTHQNKNIKVTIDQTKLDSRKALENVLKDLEDDFELHKKIYVELSDRYKSMSSKSNSTKRKTLANHLKQSIDTLEVKAQQVKRLHDLIQ
ncbi:hypothetical protein OIO90_002295 [Microbotryomycetes sp. JL221]|nr:hypothetical protein OIO90_002295 [Microbotryomycetes sp. JL221]